MRTLRMISLNWNVRLLSGCFHILGCGECCLDINYIFQVFEPAESLETGIVGGMQSQIPAKYTNHTEVGPFFYSPTPCVVFLHPLWSYQHISELLVNAGLK